MQAPNSAHMGSCRPPGAAHQTRVRPGGPFRMSLTKEDMPCERLILLPSIARLSALTGCSRFRSGRRTRWCTRLPAPQYQCTGDNEYRITVAVAGFSSRCQHRPRRTRSPSAARKQARPKPRARSHQGIARTFERVFQLADFAAKAPRWRNGLLHADLVRDTRPRSRGRFRSATAGGRRRGRGEGGLTRAKSDANKVSSVELVALRERPGNRGASF